MIFRKASGFLISGGSTLLGMSILGFVLPLFGVQFTLLQLFHTNTFYSCLTSLGLSIVAFFLATIIKMYADAKGFSKLNISEVKKFELLSEEEFILVGTLFMIHTQANRYTYNTFTMLYENLYENKFSAERIKKYTQEDDWGSRFIQRLSDKSQRPGNEDLPKEIISLITMLTYGDNEINDKEIEFMLIFRDLFGLTDEDMGNHVKHIKEQLAAA